MWVSVLLLALAVNLEPTRICLVPLLLARDRPRQQLIAFLAGNLTMSLGFGLLALFSFRHVPLATASVDGGLVKIVLGAIALVAAVVMALRWMSRRQAEAQGTAGPRGGLEENRPSLADPVAERFRKLLRKTGSPWLVGLIGMGVGLPSPDYLGVLAIIATSQHAPAEQVVALVTFVLMGSLVTLALLAGFVVAPDQTLDLAVRFGNWTRSRSQIEYAALVALVGCLMIVLGITAARP